MLVSSSLRFQVQEPDWVRCAEVPYHVIEYERRSTSELNTLQYPAMQVGWIRLD